MAAAGAGSRDRPAGDPARRLQQSAAITSAGLQLHVRTDELLAPLAPLAVSVHERDASGALLPFASELIPLAESLARAARVADATASYLPAQTSALGRPGGDGLDLPVYDVVVNVTVAEPSASGRTLFWHLLDPRTCSPSALSPGACTVLWDGNTTGSEWTTVQLHHVPFFGAVFASEFNSSFKIPAGQLTAQLLVNDSQAVSRAVLTHDFPRGLGPGLAATAVYDHLEHEFRVELPWEGLPPLGRATLPATTATPATQLNRTTELLLDFKLLCSEAGEVHHWRHSGGAIGDVFTVLPESTYFYTPGTDCSWRISGEGGSRHTYSFAVRSDGVAPGALLTIFAGSVDGRESSSTTRTYAGTNRAVDNELLVTAGEVVVTFAVDADAHPGLAPGVSFTLASPPPAVSERMVHIIITVGVVLLLLGYVVVAAWHWVRYKRVLRTREEEEIHVARNALRQLAERRAREAMRIADEQLRMQRDALPPAFAERIAVKPFKRSATGTTRTMSLDTSHTDSFKGDLCAICLDAYEDGEDVATLPCGHIFHAPCLQEWTKRSRYCPYCKDDIASALQKQVNPTADV